MKWTAIAATRMVTLGEHFARVGKGVSGAMEACNTTVSSLGSRVLAQAWSSRELAAEPEKDLPTLDPPEATARYVQALEEWG